MTVKLIAIMWPECICRACEVKVLPVQAPMHTKSLASLRMGLVRKHLGKAHKQETARQGGGAATPAGASAIISAMQETSRAIGSGAAETLEKAAESKRTNGVQEGPNHLSQLRDYHE